MSVSGSTSSRLLFRPPRDTWNPATSVVAPPEAEVTISDPDPPPLEQVKQQVVRAALMLQSHLPGGYGYGDLQAVLIPRDLDRLYRMEVAALDSMSPQRVAAGIAARVLRETVQEFYHIMSHSLPMPTYEEVVQQLFERDPDSFRDYADWVQQWMDRYDQREVRRQGLQERMDRSRARGLNGLVDYAESRLRLGVEEVTDQLVQCLLWRVRNAQELREFRALLGRIRSLVAAFVALWEFDYLKSVRRVDEAFHKAIDDMVIRPVSCAVSMTVSRIVNRAGDELLALVSQARLADCFSLGELGLTDIIEFTIDGVKDYLDRTLDFEAYFQVEQDRRQEQLREALDHSRKMERGRQVLQTIDLMILSIDQVLQSSSLLDLQMALATASDAFRRQHEAWKEKRWQRVPTATTEPYAPANSAESAG